MTINRAAAASVFAVIDRVPPIDSLSDKGDPPPSPLGQIELRNVHFVYPARPDVQILKGLSLKIKKGETVALVGPSGCGKSTVIQVHIAIDSVFFLFTVSGSKFLIEGTLFK